MLDHKFGPEIARTALPAAATARVKQLRKPVPTFGIMLYSWSMILSENRFPLFGIMLGPYSQISTLGSDSWACRRAV